MKQFLSIFLLLVLCSCSKDIPSTQIIPVTSTQFEKVTTPIQPTYNIRINNSNSIGKIKGLYIDGVIQKLDVGNYPIGYNEVGYAKTHDPICPNVYFPNGCKTVLTVLYENGDKFNSVSIKRIKNGAGQVYIDGLSASIDGINFIWNGVYSSSNTSLLGVNWNGKKIQPSNDIWVEPIEIIAK